jgi:hypothetical protein
MQTDPTPAGTAGGRAPWVGLAVALGLVAAAVLVPRVTGWEVWSHGKPAAVNVPPLHSKWRPQLGVGTVPALAIAALGWWAAVAWAERLPWRRLLTLSYLVGLAWLLALAYVDGSSGISRSLAHGYEYLDTARATSDVPAMLREYVDRIPFSHPDNWPVHVAGHPPGAVLFFILLDRLGLAGDWSAGMVVTVIAASTPVAVLTTLRALGAEAAARKAAPFLVLGPAAIWTAVTADALFAAVAAWGLAALAVGATAARRSSAVAWSVLAGLLLGSCVMMSYGLPLLGLLAAGVLVAARSWLPLPVAAATAGAVVLAFAAGGFEWWEAFPVLRERYWAGLADKRPAAYWMWGNLAALMLCAGPLLGAALARLVTAPRTHDRVVVLLSGAALAAVLLADLSRMSKAEVERIWLPFVPWLLVSTALLPRRWRRAGLGLQLAVALVLQHLLYTSW